MVTFLGAPIVCMRGKNLAFTFFTDQLPRRYHKYVELVTTIASVILFALLFYYGAIKTLEYFRYNATINTLGNIPKWIFSVWIPVGALMFIYRTVQVSVLSFKEEKVRQDKDKLSSNGKEEFL